MSLLVHPPRRGTVLGADMQKQRTAFFSVSVLALGLLGYAAVPGAGDQAANASGGALAQNGSQDVQACGPVAMSGTQGCVRAEDSASAYGRLSNDDGTTTVWSVTFAQDGESRIKRYRDLLLTADGSLQYETVITIESGPRGIHELREVRNAEGQKLFHETRRQAAEGGEVAIEQMPIAGDPEEVIALLQRATYTLRQAVALAPSV